MMDLSNLVVPCLMHVPPEAADLSHVFCNHPPAKELMGLMRRINKESLIRERLVTFNLNNCSIKIAMP